MSVARPSFPRSFLRGIFCVLCLWLLAPHPASAQTGTIVGQVVDQATLRPLSGAQVFIPALGVGTLTQANGRFILINVPAGTHRIEAALIGYVQSGQDVEVTDGGQATVDFSMRSSAISLDEVVVSGVGVQEERRRLGYASAAVTSAEIETRPVQTVAQALRGGIAGVMPTASGGEAGNGQRIMLRGQVSLTQRNDPILYIDGVRVDSRMGQVGNMLTSRLDDINPADIERIEVIKGAAAATLFGTEASAGVIQIFTKRGAQGAPRYSFTIEQGTSNILFTDGELKGGRIPPNIQYDTVNDRFVRQDVMRDILDRTYLQNYNLSVSGGTTDFNYYLSGRFMNENGVAPNSLTRNLSGRARFDLSHGEKYRSEVSLSMIRNSVRVPSEGGSLGPLTVQTFAVPLRADTAAGLPYGESLISAKELSEGENWQHADRYAASYKGIMEWTPTLVSQAVVGFERSDELNDETVELGQALLQRNNVNGKRRIQNRRRDQLTLDVNTSWAPRITNDLGAQLWAGGQAFWERDFGTFMQSTHFPAAGLSTVQAGANILTFSEERVEVKNVGFFTQGQIDFRDRLFLTAGLRVDGNSAFGKNYGLSTYPKFSGSWVVSDEPFWFGGTTLGLFRLRAAWGQSGLQPGTFDSEQTWEPRTRLGGSVVWPGNVGNPDLKPERSTELEMGVDFGLFEDRVGVEVTHYRQRTTDAIIARPLPASLGFTSSQMSNIGELTSRGWETMVRWNVIRRPDFDWTMTATSGTVNQKVISLGEGVDRISFTGLRAEYAIVPGYAPGVWRTTVVDPNDPYRTTVPIDQVTQITQIIPNILKAANGQDSIVIHPKNAVPTLTGSFATEFGLPHNLRLRALFTGARGFTMFSVHEVVTYQNGVRPDASRLIAELDNPATTPERRAELAREYAFKSNQAWGNWVEDADYLRFQELTLMYQVPQSFASRLGLSNLSVNLTGNNLYLWTVYTGTAEPGTPAPNPSTIVINNHRAHLPATRGFTISLTGGW